MLKRSPPPATSASAPAPSGEAPPVSLAHLFSQSDLERIARAVSAAEAETSGELVPFAVAASDRYEVARWRAIAAGGFSGALVASVVHELGNHWGGWFAFWLLLPLLAGAALGYALSYVPAIKRFLIGTSEMVRRVEARAERAFLHEEVFATAQRTGILVFLSLFERRVVILGDTEISSRVDRREWDSIVAGIVTGIRSGRPGESLVEGIERCGTLLARRGVEAGPDDRNEISDGLRIESR